MERDYKVVTLSSELNVLIATALWLLRNGWTIEAMSIAVGHGLPSIDYQKGKIREALVGEKVETISFKAKGPDIVARSQEGIWRIECKGMGGGKSQTHRNNFDRAVASVMSYFDDSSTRLGLALANDYLWAYNFQERLPRPLREATNLWIFLLEKETLYLYKPSDELPFPGVI